MKVGLSPGDELATRVGRVLLADRRLEQLGVPRPQTSEPRTVPLTGFTADVVIAFDLGHPYVTAALEVGTPVVTVEGEATTESGGLSTMAASLASQMNGDDIELVAWTASGSELREGVVVDFPEPLGRVHGSETPTGVVVPNDGQWAGVLVQATDGDGRQRTIAAVDDVLFMTSISLVARAISFLEGEESPGPRFLEEAQAAGIEFAAVPGH